MSRYDELCRAAGVCVPEAYMEPSTGVPVWVPGVAVDVHDVDFSYVMTPTSSGYNQGE